IAIGPLSPVLSWAKSGRLLFAYFEQAGYNIYSVEDPRTLPRTPAGALTSAPVVAETPAPAPPAVALAPATVGGGVEAPRDPYVASFYRSAEGFRPSAQAPRADAAPGPTDESPPRSGRRTRRRDRAAPPPRLRPSRARARPRAAPVPAFRRPPARS